MVFNLLTLFIALSISAVAIYYSVAGLATIFAASVIPIIIMGTTLEIAKLVTAVWLHKHWRDAVWWLKTYLSTAVIVLMFITSMGIFGFLSKSHIEQAAASDEQTAKIESINSRIERSNIKVERWQAEIKKLSSGEADTRVDTLIEREQKELNRITGVVNAEKQTVRDASEKTIASINANLAATREAHAAEMPALLKAASSCFSCREEEAAVAAANEKFAAAETRANKLVDEAQANLKAELAKIDDKYKLQFDEVNKRLAKLKKQSETKTGDIDERISKLEKDLEAEQAAVDKVREEKAVLESQFRKLEAEVGPVKYIAQFVYGPEAGRDLLEEAVRWVIITIIFVFDPLAVLLLIASQYSFEMARDKKKKNDPRSDTDLNIPDTTYNINLQTAPIPTPSAAPEPETIEPPLIPDFPEREQPQEQERESLDPTPAPKKKASKKKKKVKKRESKPESKKESRSVSNAKVVQSHNEKVIEDPNALRNDTPKTPMVRSGEYINYRGKNYRDVVLNDVYPELNLDYYLKHRVPFGPRFPEKMFAGRMFLRTDLLPTKLYRSNGEEWEAQDKNILNANSYADEYIQLLVDKVAEGEYNPELLNIVERELIKKQIANEF